MTHQHLINHIYDISRLDHSLDPSTNQSGTLFDTHPQVDDYSYGEYMEVKFQITASYEYDYLCF